MGVKLGRMLVCSRCGETVFEEEREPKGDEGWARGNRFFNKTEGWDAWSSVKLSDYISGRNETVMCPSCKKLYDDTIEEFWSFGKTVTE